MFEGAVGDYGYALPATGAAISAALDNVYLDAGVAIDLDLSMQSKDAAGLLATLVKARGLGPRIVTIRFGFGPLGGIAMSGHSPLAVEATSRRSLPDSSPISRRKVSPVPSLSPTAG